MNTFKSSISIFVSGMLLISFFVSFSAVAISDSKSASVAKKVWKFNAYLGDDLIGYHNFEVTTDTGNDMTMSVYTEADFDIRFLFMSVYTYKHKNNELWKNNCLVKLSSTTDDNGEEEFVRLSGSGNATKIQTPLGEVTSERCVRSFAYWDPALIKDQVLLNSQTGELIATKFELIGNENISVNENQVLASKYLLSGKDAEGNIVEIDLWYTLNDEWVKLRSKLENGSYLSYQLVMEDKQENDPGGEL